MDFTKTVTRMGSAIGAEELLKTLSRLRLDDVVGVVGLERRRSASSQFLPVLGLITLSAMVGAGAALLLAPSSGRRLRARLSDELTDAKHRLSDSISKNEISRGHRHAVS